MTIAAWLMDTMKQLGAAGVDSPRRDALVLLEDTLQKDRAWVLAHPEYILQDSEYSAVQKLIQQRVKRVPLAYIRGKAWFYGRFFVVNSDVLIPRPETETFVELLKALVTDGYTPDTVIDIGTGSGALAITAKLELPNTSVIATELSSKALAVAKINAQKHQAEIQFASGSLLEPLTAQQLAGSTILTNLPYVPHDLITSTEITQEPPQALFSGIDGLDHYRLFWNQITEAGATPAIILTESLEDQHASLTTLAKAAGYTLDRTDVLIQVFRKTN